MVGDIMAIFCARSSTKLRTFGLRLGLPDPDSVSVIWFMMAFTLILTFLVRNENDPAGLRY
jgi:hypothetical protein